jgi:hypothetical protein
MDNPFEGIVRAFASDVPPVTHSFKLYDEDCFVEVCRMNGSQMSAFRTIGQGLEVDPSKRTVEKAIFKEAQEEKEAHLLISAVSDFRIASKDHTTGAIEVSEGKNRKTNTPMPEAAKASVFRNLDTDFRTILVRVCCEVNGLNPLTLMPGTVE